MMASQHRLITVAALLEGWVSLPSPQATCEISDLSLHSAELGPNSGFVALAGAHGHGLEYADQALAAGARVILHDGQGDPARVAQWAKRVPVIEVPQLAHRLPELADRMWPGLDQLDLLAVTGTNGKTSLAWLLAQALDGAMIGTLGIGRPGQHHAGRHTTPDRLSLQRHLHQLQQQGLHTVCIEASSHALDQGRLAGLSWSSAVFTNLGHDHLDYHGSLEAYGAAKQRLFSDYASERQLINLDDDFGRALANRLTEAGASPLTYAIEQAKQAHASAQILSARPDGMQLQLQVGQQSFCVDSKLIGRANAYNLLVVAIELAARDGSVADMVQRLEALEPVPGRMQALKHAQSSAQTQGPAQVVVDYAHDPDALRNALQACRTLTPAHLWCVFGCGGDRDRAKRPRMGAVAEALADQIILTDDNPRHEDGLSIIRMIQAGMHQPERARVRRDRAEAIALALAESGPDDVVLVAGKGHESEQIIGDERRPFSDQQQVLTWLEARAC